MPFGPRWIHFYALFGILDSRIRLSGSTNLEATRTNVGAYDLRIDRGASKIGVQGCAVRGQRFSVVSFFIVFSTLLLVSLPGVVDGAGFAGCVSHGDKGRFLSRAVLLRRWDLKGPGASVKSERIQEKQCQS
jgi:hypothetical protein